MTVARTWARTGQRTGTMAAVRAFMMSRRLPRRPKSRITRKARIDLRLCWRTSLTLSLPHFPPSLSRVSLSLSISAPPPPFSHTLACARRMCTACARCARCVCVRAPARSRASGTISRLRRVEHPRIGHHARDNENGVGRNLGAIPRICLHSLGRPVEQPGIGHRAQACRQERPSRGSATGPRPRGPVGTRRARRTRARASAPSPRRPQKKFSL